MIRSALILLVLLLPAGPAQAQMTTCRAEGHWTWCNDADGSDCEERTERGLGSHSSSERASREAIASCEAAVARATAGADMSGGAGVPGAGCRVVDCSVLAPPPETLTVRLSTTASPNSTALPTDTPECAYFVGVLCQMCGPAACSRFQERALHPDACRQLGATLSQVGGMGGAPAQMEAMAFGMCHQLTGP